MMNRVESASRVQQMPQIDGNMQVQCAGIAWQRAMEQPITDDEIFTQMRLMQEDIDSRSNQLMRGNWRNEQQMNAEDDAVGAATMVTTETSRISNGGASSSMHQRKV